MNITLLTPNAQPRQSYAAKVHAPTKWTFHHIGHKLAAELNQKERWHDNSARLIYVYYGLPSAFNHRCEFYRSNAFVGRYRWWWRINVHKNTRIGHKIMNPLTILRLIFWRPLPVFFRRRIFIGCIDNQRAKQCWLVSRIARNVGRSRHQCDVTRSNLWADPMSNRVWTGPLRLRD